MEFGQVISIDETGRVSRGGGGAGRGGGAGGGGGTRGGGWTRWAGMWGQLYTQSQIH
jgi:hypothetical protein